jgi:hypothetical protein
MHDGLKALGALANLGRKKPAASSAASAPTVPPSPLRREVMAVMSEAMHLMGMKVSDPRRVMLSTVLSLRSEQELADMVRLVMAVADRLRAVMPDESGNGVTVNDASG